MTTETEQHPELIAFINSFLETQAKAYQAYLKQDIKKLNKLVDELNGFGTQHMQDRFGISYQTKIDSSIAELYEDDETVCVPGILFMVKKYNYHQFGKLYRAYVSAFNPYKKIVSKCLFITEVKEKFTIVAQYSFIENRKKHNPVWENSGGEDIDLNRLGKAIESIKFTAPSDNPAQLKEYEI